MVQGVGGVACANSNRSAVSIGTQSLVWESSRRRVATNKRRVLIGEFRDEVYSDLESLFKGQGFEVTRAYCGMAVSFQVHESRPDLVLLNERFTDQSGWLVAAKLQMFKTPPQVWLYTSRLSTRVRMQQEVCQINELLAYRGILSLLRFQVQELTRSLFMASDNKEAINE